MNIGPQVESLYAAPPRGRAHGDGEENRASLLELRTDAGLLYVQPVGWQRVWLLWTFRHFHVVPQQLLSRRAQRLIETLSHSARVTPSLPVPKSTIFGVVENVRTKPEFPIVSEPPSPKAQERPVDGLRVARFPWGWGVLGMAMTVCLIMILAYGVSLLTGTMHKRKPSALLEPALSVPVRVSPPNQPVAEKVEHPAARPESAVVTRKSPAPAPPIVDPEHAAAPPESIAPAADSQRAYVAELPQGQLVQPVVSDPNLTGELQLRALIGPDGSVQDVTVVSGNPKMAPAAILAVRRWHYAKNQAAGPDGEREALIRMDFFGRDAVSITSVAR